MSKNVDILILANTGTEETPSFNPVGGQRDASLSEEVDEIDVTTKLSEGGMKEYEYGEGGWSISCDGLHVPSDEAYEVLKNAIREKKKVLVRISENGTSIDEGLALVTSRELSAPRNADTTYSVNLLGTGKLNPVSA
ncbi:hypothetical protein BTR23_07460 [Alkalihalophilus pseudofirmus]|nr:hypothetical protein BTR23_07460 [Alkalihalophilus pseudofirmus]